MQKFLLNLLSTTFAVWLATGSLSAATYYVSPKGNDANSGTSPGSPWQTLAKVNSRTLAAGDSVLFQGGTTLSGGLSVKVRASETAPVTFGSYGKGSATISAGKGMGLYAYNCSGVVVQDLNFVGAGAGTNTVDGIEFYADVSGNTKLAYIRIDDVNVSGFGGNGITIGSWNNLTGYQDTQVTNSIVHDNARNGIQVYAQARNANSTIYVGACQVYNNTGIPNLSTPTGNGIVLAEVNGGVVEGCDAYNNGASGTYDEGPVGIWCYDSNNIVIQYNESYGNKTTGADGDGFDLDGGTTNSYLQYNYSHDNMGAGFCLFQYTGSAAFSGNTIRFNVSQNDGLGGVAVWGEDATALVTSSKVYNNTIYVGQHAAINFYNSNFSNLLFYNNVLVTTGGKDLIYCPSNTGATFRGNDYWSSGNAFSIDWNGATYSNLSAWRSATAQEKNGGTSTGVNVNPLVASIGAGGTVAGNDPVNAMTAYKLQSGSTMTSGGINLSGQGISPGTVDYYGNAFSTGSTAIGACVAH